VGHKTPFSKGGEQKTLFNVGSNTPFSKTFNFVDTSTTHPTKGLPLKSFPTPQTHSTERKSKLLMLKRID
jgi:hypothetical protein